MNVDDNFTRMNEEKTILKKKTIIRVLAAVVVLATVFVSGKAFGDNLVLWGGESNLTEIQNNLATLDGLLSKKNNLFQL